MLEYNICYFITKLNSTKVSQVFSVDQAICRSLSVEPNSAFGIWSPRKATSTSHWVWAWLSSTQACSYHFICVMAMSLEYKSEYLIVAIFFTLFLFLNLLFDFLKLFQIIFFLILLNPKRLIFSFISFFFTQKVIFSVSFVGVVYSQ